MFKGALFKGPPTLRLAVTIAAALSVSAATVPVFAQDSRSLQDMLLAAVRLGDSAAVRSLLSAGADVAKRGPNCKTAIDVAVETGRFEIAELLVQERRRQRDAQIAQPIAPATPADIEIVQQSAEAAPEVVAQRPVVLPRPVLPAPPVTYVPTPKPATSTASNVQNGATVEQLLAVAQQLTLAAQNLAATQRQSSQAAAPMPPQRDVPPARLAQPIDPEFLPRPGRKPEIEQASLAAPSVAANTVVVTPRRRATVEEGAEQARRDLEAGQDLPAIPETETSKPMAQPVQAAIRVPPAPRGPTPAPASASSAQSEDTDGGLARTMRGIGTFFGIGDSKKQDAEVTPTPTHAKPGASRELLKRDRANVPHVPARRASDLQSQLAPQAQPLLQSQVQSHAMAPSPARTATTAQQLAALDAPVQAGMPPVKAVPVAPVQEHAMTIPTTSGASSVAGQLPPPNMSAPSLQSARLSVRKSNGLNPFDPDNMPQGSVLPLTDPLAGNAPEIARPKVLAETAEEKLAMAAQEADLRETLRQSAAPQRTPKPAASTVVLDVPPMPDSAKPASPTAMFERRAPQPPLSAVTKPAAKSEDGVLKNLASAVGIVSNDDELPSDDAARGGSERITSNRMPVLSLRGPLKDIPLTLGNSVATDQKPLPRGVAEPDPCIKRSGGTLQFCVVPVDWHPRVDPAFSLTTYLYQDSRAIARYDAGKATHYHTLFSSLAYDDVVKYFTAKYGPPTDEWKRSIAPFDQPRQPNPTLVWRSKDSRTNKVTILEVRRYDDTRNVFPDMEHGAVRLYLAGAQRVFPVISGMDLMGIDWAARSDHTDNPNDPALANTIRVGR